jgi:WD40 repeat protein
MEDPNVPEGHNNVTLVDVATAAQVGQPLPGHESSVTAVAFSHDGAQVASGDRDGEIRLWDVASRRLLGAPIETGAGIEALSFSAEDTTLASGGTDGRLGLWDTDPKSWIERLCATANRDLTTAEWAEFVGDSPYEPTCPGDG